MTIENYINMGVNVLVMTLLEKIVKIAPKPVRAIALAAAMPILFYGQTVVPISSSAVTAQPLTGVAATSTAKLGASTDVRYTYNNDLSSGSSSATIYSGVSDMGSGNDSFYLTLASGLIEKKNISNNGTFSSMSLSGTQAISSIFNYQGTDSFAAVASNNDINIYNWGNTSPVATLFNAGTGITGLDVRVSNTSGVVNDLNSDLQIFTTNSNNTFNYATATGSSLGSYVLSGSLGSFNDVVYMDGMVTLGLNDSGDFGRLINVNFSGYQTAAVPEPATTGLIAGGLGLLAAMLRRKFRRC